MDEAFKITQGWPADDDAMAEFLTRNKDFDTISTSLLREKLYQDPTANPQLCLTATTHGETSGFLYAVMREIRGQKIGYIKLMAVDKHVRRKKIGTSLYQHAESLLKKEGATQIRWYDVPLNYFMPGIDPRYTEAWCFVLKMGFRQTGEAINMIVDLNSMDWSTAAEESSLKNKGVVIKRASLSDHGAIKELLDQEWQLWNNEVDMAMKDDPPSVHIAFINNKLRAFSVHNGNNKGTGWFGPMGTHAETRGLGIGSILLKRCLEDMRNQGYRTCIIPWVGPVSFYAHYAGARIDRVFWRVEKDI